MMTLTFATLKGGAGKTTCSLNIGRALAVSEQAVAIRDFDETHHAATCWLPEWDLIKLYDPKEKYDFVICDPSADRAAFEKAVSESDLVIVPTIPTVEGIRSTTVTASVLKEVFPDKLALVLFNCVQAGTTMADQLNALAKETGLPALKNHLRRLTSYDRSLAYAWRGVKPEYRNEIANVALEIMQKAVSLNSTKTKGKRK